VTDPSLIGSFKMASTTVATATIRAVTGRKILPTRAALTLVSVLLIIYSCIHVFHISPLLFFLQKSNCSDLLRTRVATFQRIRIENKNKEACKKM